MPLTTAGGTRILNGGALRPVCTHLMLCTSDPGNAGNLATEVANSGGYARLPITWTGSTYWSQNSLELLFEASGNWGTITWVGLVNSGTHGAGTMYVRHPITSVQVLANQRLRFVAGAIRLEAERS